VAGDPRAKAMAATAQTFVLTFTNFDPNSVDRAFNHLQALGTGEFAKEADAMLGESIRKQLKVKQASMRGSIDHLYVQDLDKAGDAGEVYAAVGVHYANNTSPETTADELRFVLSLRKVSGDWKGDVARVLGGSSVSLPTTGGGGGPGGSGSGG
jgi:hypothetical protein